MEDKRVSSSFLRRSQQKDARIGTSRTSHSPDAVKPRAPRKLRHADTGSTWLLTESPQEAAVAPAFPHFTTRRPAGLPGAPRLAVQIGGGPAPAAGAAPPGAGQAEGSGGPRRGRSCVSLLPGRRQLGSTVGLAGAGWRRAEQGDWGHGWLRLSAARAEPCSAALLGGTARLQQQPRPPSPRGRRAPAAAEAPLCPEQPRWQRAQHAHTGRTAHQSEQRFSQAVRGQFGTGVCQTQDVPPAQRVTVTRGARCWQRPAQLQPRTEQCAQRAGEAGSQRPLDTAGGARRVAPGRAAEPCRGAARCPRRGMAARPVPRPDAPSGGNPHRAGGNGTSPGRRRMAKRSGTPPATQPQGSARGAPGRNAGTGEGPEPRSPSPRQRPGAARHFRPQHGPRPGGSGGGSGSG
ncbi:translation initiation factor IF-2-like [Pyrgilauda ruficollis]|uniref:translation initiation factor IF-2-like n=1 Tax=Pyrgilauda ruficollis TaxID=221976 RepID=UPI001B873916|nr:translation initiation factor IF-2-like [Pyrgilauda ruficollis]